MVYNLMMCFIHVGGLGGRRGGGGGGVADESGKAAPQSDKAPPRGGGGGAVDEEPCQQAQGTWEISWCRTARDHPHDIVGRVRPIFDPVVLYYTSHGN